MAPWLSRVPVAKKKKKKVVGSIFNAEPTDCSTKYGQTAYVCTPEYSSLDRFQPEINLQDKDPIQSTNTIDSI